MEDQYLDAFVRESEETITALNNSLLDLESDPSDTEAMEDIFRRAHTLKGNFGAMGLEDGAKLAHAIEDLLDELRESELDVTPEVMDLVFAGVDRIETIVRAIESNGEADVDTGPIVSELRATLDDGSETAGDSPSDSDGSVDGDNSVDEDGDGSVDGGGSVDGSGNSDDPRVAEIGDDAGDGGRAGGGTTPQQGTDVAGVVDEDDLPALDPADVDGKVIQAAVSIDASGMAGVDAMLALDGIENSHDILTSSPDREAIENGSFEERVVLYLAAPDVNSAAESLSTVGKIAHFDLTDVTGDLDANVSDEPRGGPESSGTASGDAGSPTDHSVQEIKSVRVDVDQLDDLHGLVEQLVTSRIKLRRAVEMDDISAAGENLNELDKITANLQNTVMDVRLIPLKNVIGKLPRLVRDLSRELGKSVDLTIDGEDVELDRTILTEISDPLMHILRNALDHGIERPDERERKGKPRTGTIELRASRERDHVIIEVEDDGSGLDVAGIKATAAQQDVRSPDELETMDDSAIYDLIFHPGFSTADEVTDTSGRGVGMDVVHDTVTQLDGSVSVDATPGEGTTVSLRLPVTMAIVKVLFVEVGDEEYGVPLKNVDEITRSSGVRRVNGQDVIKHDDEIYPVIPLDETFDVPGTVTNGDGMLVRIREAERRVALHCDSVNSQEEVVVKPLEGILSGTPGLSGTAVLGDGNIVHILDVVTL